MTECRKAEQLISRDLSSGRTIAGVRILLPFEASEKP